ncbi:MULTISPECIES: hypothetical protein [Paraburkholderia]|uniref:Uncharacterized protein n=1 Tax=Paraburkholderia madseniana TaxID=2599607 RepID=A0AAP5BDH3_9BURK|nr:MULTISPECIES: hypothetical protein [Paraburkholderia]MCX4146905.1 hypothetical protein [Paraburkholderia madseniana]MDN7149851.1 hypothetical protein [Paraburkholderia sp. WS6]MDQ6408731.1 hypothetical protein [Paraburkholderia madseniana]
MLIQKFHPGLQPGQQLAVAGSGTPLFSRQSHWDCCGALHCVAMALALLGRLDDPVDIRRSDAGPEASFWDRAWPHYLHGLTLTELASFVWELNLGVRPVAARAGQTTVLRFCEQELSRGAPVIVGWRSLHPVQRRASLAIGVEGLRRQRAFSPHALLILDPAGMEPGLAACNARLEFGRDRRIAYVTATAKHRVAVDGAVSIRLLKAGS